MPWNVPAGGKAPPYVVNGSIRLADFAQYYFNKAAGSSGDVQMWTFSCWLKRGNLPQAHCTIFGVFHVSGGGTINYQHLLRFTPTDTLEFSVYRDTGFNAQKISSAAFRDVGAYYHIVAVWDTRNASAAERMRLYVNGVRLGSFTTSVDPPAAFTLGVINSGYAHNLGAIQSAGYGGGAPIQFTDGHLAEVHFLDGIGLDCNAFGKFDPETNTWVPKRYAGTYGARGWYLKFTDSSSNAALGTDYSGNGNHWTPVNTAAGAASIDTPTGAGDGVSTTMRGNFCHMDPNNGTGNAQIFVGDGGRYVYAAGVTAPWRSICGSQAYPITADYFFEVYVNALPSADAGIIGVLNPWVPRPGYAGQVNGSVGYQSSGGIHNNSANVGGFPTYAVNDVIGVSVHTGTGGVNFYKNGVFIGYGGTIALGGSVIDEWTPCLSFYYAGTAYSFNPGSMGGFWYGTPAIGRKMLCTQALSTPPIKRSDSHFASNYRAGTGVAYSVTDKRFQPNVVWTKNLSRAYWPVLADSVRGPDRNNYTNSNNAEVATDAITAFTANGWTGGTDISFNNAGDWNVDWVFKNSTLSGCNMVTYSGTGVARTIPHGLGVAPTMIIVKGRDDPNNYWMVYHSSIGATQYIHLNHPSLALANAAIWNNTAPTASVFSVGTHPSVNAAGFTYHAWCFHDVPGFSRFGWYHGTANTEGKYVYTGFRPRTILFKMVTANADWVTRDAWRNAYSGNPNYYDIWPGVSAANGQAVGPHLDILSNGFRWRAADAAYNGSGNFAFAAFADAPAKHALGV